MKIGILLSGCGVYDGAEIQEAVSAMLATLQEGHTYQCIGVDAAQHHVVNHLTGEEMPESRNMLTEAARIARGNIIEIKSVATEMIDALLIPGGFGSAKNFTKWAFEGPDGAILPQVADLLNQMHQAGKPIIALCVSPVVLAKAFEHKLQLQLTLGTDSEPTPYEIEAMHDGLEKTGAIASKKGIEELQIDRVNKTVCAPCYMQETTLDKVYTNARMAIQALATL